MQAIGVGLAATVLAGCADTTAGREQVAEAGVGTVPAKQLDDQTRPPWPLPTDVATRVAAAGLDLGPMGTAEHHTRGRVVVDGHDVLVPGGIGVDPGTGATSAPHTHEPDGTLHVEAGTVGETFSLDRLFAKWASSSPPSRSAGWWPRTVRC